MCVSTYIWRLLTCPTALTYVAGSKASRVPASDNIAYSVLSTADSGGGVAAAEGVEIHVEDNKAYVTYSPPEATAGDPQGSGESGDQDVYEHVN